MNDDCFEDALARELAAYQEKLERGAVEPGSSTPTAGGEPIPAELQQLLEEQKRCLDLLHAVRPRRVENELANLPGQGETRPAGRFQILDELGSGGFGIVWRARDPATGRIVALKVPRPEVLTSAELRKRFEQEAEAAARLDHPNIVPILEAGTDGVVPYIASVYYEGPTLAKWLSEHEGRVSPREAARITLALAKALTHAHERGVLHRDVKPSNVLLAPVALDDSRELPFEPKLMDFGLAKLGERDQELTRTGAMLGTLKYMAPEQAAGRAKEITAATDVYGLGVVLYELLAGAPPFSSESDWLTLRQVLEDEPRSLSAVRRDVPRDLAVIVQKCLNKTPAQRYRSARELAEDLERYLAGKSIVARPVPPVERLMKWCRRNPAWAALVGVVALAMVSGVAFLTYSNVRIAAALEAEKAVREQLAMRLYASDLRRADEAMDQNNVRHALEILQTYEKPAGGQDMREFAWQFLWRRLPKQRPYVEQHSREVYSLSASTDEKLLATGCADGKVRVWQAGVKEPLQTFDCAGAEVNEVRFSPDDKWLAAACEDGLVRVWETATWQRKHELPIGGVTTTDAFADRDRHRAIALQPNGMIVSVGDSIRTNPVAAVARYKPDGQLDPSFNESGLISLWRSKAAADLTSVIVEPDGKILVAGYALNFDLAVARLHPDGTLDESFAEQGEFHLDLGSENDSVAAAIRQADGSYLLVCQTNLGNEGASVAISLVRLLPSGLLDETFGNSGVLMAALGPGEHIPLAATQLTDGRIVVAGYRKPPGSSGRKSNALLLRFLTDGTLDETFDGDGILEMAISPTHDLFTSLAIQPDGKLVAAGHANRDEQRQMVAVRLNENGTADPTFGNNGIAPVESPSQYASAQALVIMPDGKVVLVGTAARDSGSRFAIARLHENGLLDHTFGSDGHVEMQIGLVSELQGAVLQPDGKILVCGFAYCSGETQEAANAVVARFLPDGALDGTFSSNGAQGVRFAANSARLIAYSDYCFRLWDPDTGELQAEAYDPYTKLDALDADWHGDRIVTAAGTAVRFWDCNDVRAPRAIVDDFRGITSLGLLPNLDQVVVGSAKGEITIVSSAKEEALRTLLTSKSDRSRAIRVSKDGSHLAVAFNHAVLVYRTSDWSLVTEIFGHSRAFDELFLGDDEVLLTSHVDGSISEWELPKKGTSALGDAARTLFVGKAEIGAMDFSSDAKLVAAGGKDGRVLVVASESGDVLLDIVGQNSHVHGIGFVDDERKLLVGYASGVVVVFDLLSKAESSQFGVGSPIKKLVVAPSADRFAVALDQSQIVQIRAWPGGEVLSELSHSDALAHLSFTPDGRSLIMSHGPNLEVFDVASGRKIGGTTRLGTSYPHFQAWPDGSRVLVAEEKEGMVIRELPSCRVLHQAFGRQQSVNRVAISFDGRNLASDGLNGELVIWDARTLEPLLTIDDGVGAAYPLDLRFSRDGRKLFGYESGSLHVWEAQ